MIEESPEDQLVHAEDVDDKDIRHIQVLLAKYPKKIEIAKLEGILDKNGKVSRKIFQYEKRLGYADIKFPSFYLMTPECRAKFLDEKSDAFMDLMLKLREYFNALKPEERIAWISKTLADIGKKLDDATQKKIEDKYNHECAFYLECFISSDAAFRLNHWRTKVMLKEGLDEYKVLQHLIDNYLDFKINEYQYKRLVAAYDAIAKK